jgi:hypothetical protein
MRDFITLINHPDNVSHSLHNISSMFLQIEYAITYFRERYGLLHNDLHAGNVLFTESFTPKLIDFGRSSITLNGVFYSMDTTPFPQSYDLLIFVTSFYVYYANRCVDPSVKEAIRQLFQDGLSFNLLDELEKRKSHVGIGDITHCMYPDYINSNSFRSIWTIAYGEGVVLGSLDATKRVLQRVMDPVEFRGFWNQRVEGGGGGGGSMVNEEPVEEPMTGGNRRKSLSRRTRTKKISSTTLRKGSRLKAQKKSLKRHLLDV